MELFTKKNIKSAPLLIIKKEKNCANVTDYNSVEDAIKDLEKDPKVPSEKIEKLRSSLEKLKNNSSIKIRNGEIIK